MLNLLKLLLKSYLHEKYPRKRVRKGIRELYVQKILASVISKLESQCFRVLGE